MARLLSLVSKRFGGVLTGAQEDEPQTLLKENRDAHSL